MCAREGEEWCESVAVQRHVGTIDIGRAQTHVRFINISRLSSRFSILLAFGLAWGRHGCCCAGCAPPALPLLMPLPLPLPPRGAVFCGPDARAPALFPPRPAPPLLLFPRASRLDALPYAIAVV